MITIIGSGKVGGDAALFSALKRLDDQILLLDVVEGLPQGEAMDINHMLSEQGIDVEVKGSNNFEDMKGSNVVVVVAGSGRKPGTAGGLRGPDCPCQRLSSSSEFQQRVDRRAAQV